MTANLFTHIAAIKRLDQTDVDGAPSYDWVTVLTGVKCRLDLTFLRAGKDVGWSHEAGRAPDRSGVLFMPAGTDVRPGDRVVMSAPVAGTFEVTGAVDEAASLSGISHLEIGVSEVAQAVA